ncbi:MAG: Eco57I restriction-modification methylase domain-containing protein, partial [Atopobiaceae bacterium]|nr:Eco57I restriction-modification methylase domain-containing protein [Atopobiaceae bacterium]
MCPPFPCLLIPQDEPWRQPEPVTAHSHAKHSFEERDLASLAGGASLFAGAAEAKLRLLRAELAPLAARYDVVVANPPYMGSSSMNRWMGAWVKRRYPEECRDLCTCFIERGFSLCGDHGSSAMITMQSWMFLGSYERMRKKLLEGHAISSMAHLGTRAFGAIGGEVVSTTATVFSAAPS